MSFELEVVAAPGFSAGRVIAPREWTIDVHQHYVPLTPVAVCDDEAASAAAAAVSATTALPSLTLAGVAESFVSFNTARMERLSFSLQDERDEEAEAALGGALLFFSEVFVPRGVEGEARIVACLLSQEKSNERDGGGGSPLLNALLSSSSDASPLASSSSCVSSTTVQEVIPQGRRPSRRSFGGSGIGNAHEGAPESHSIAAKLSYTHRVFLVITAVTTPATMGSTFQEGDADKTNSENDDERQEREEEYAQEAAAVQAQQHEELSGLASCVLQRALRLYEDSFEDMEPLTEPIGGSGGVSQAAMARSGSSIALSCASSTLYGVGVGHVAIAVPSARAVLQLSPPPPLMLSPSSPSAGLACVGGSSSSNTSNGIPVCCGGRSAFGACYPFSLCWNTTTITPADTNGGSFFAAAAPPSHWPSLVPTTVSAASGGNSSSNSRSGAAAVAAAVDNSPSSPAAAAVTFSAPASPLSASASAAADASAEYLRHMMIDVLCFSDAAFFTLGSPPPVSDPSSPVLSSASAGGGACCSQPRTRAIPLAVATFSLADVLGYSVYNYPSVEMAFEEHLRRHCSAASIAAAAANNNGGNDKNKSKKALHPASAFLSDAEVAGAAAPARSLASLMTFPIEVERLSQPAPRFMPSRDFLSKVEQTLVVEEQLDRRAARRQNADVDIAIAARCSHFTVGGERGGARALLTVYAPRVDSCRAVVVAAALHPRDLPTTSEEQLVRWARATFSLRTPHSWLWADLASAAGTAAVSVSVPSPRVALPATAALASQGMLALRLPLLPAYASARVLPTAATCFSSLGSLTVTAPAPAAVTTAAGAPPQPSAPPGAAEADGQEGETRGCARLVGPISAVLTVCREGCSASDYLDFVISEYQYNLGIKTVNNVAARSQISHCPGVFEVRGRGGASKINSSNSASANGRRSNNTGTSCCAVAGETAFAFLRVGTRDLYYVRVQETSAVGQLIITEAHAVCIGRSSVDEDPRPRSVAAATGDEKSNLCAGKRGAAVEPPPSEWVALAETQLAAWISGIDVRVNGSGDGDGSSTF